MEKLETLPGKLTELLWELVLRELEQEGLDGALVRCELSGEARNGRPVLNIRFLGKTHSIPELPPLEKSLLIFAGRKRCALYSL